MKAEQLPIAHLFDHFFFDAVAGALTIGAGFLLARLLDINERQSRIPALTNPAGECELPLRSSAIGPYVCSRARANTRKRPSCVGRPAGRHAAKCLLVARQPSSRTPGGL
jgi:hypothetical protein